MVSRPMIAKLMHPSLALLTAFAVFAVARPAAAEQVRLDVGVSSPVMKAGEKQINHMRISLTGFDVPESKERPPINTAIVIDRSGSMNGEKIARAREAAIAAVERLRDDDIVSIVLYSDSAMVLVPATKATDRESIVEKIRGITAGGSTALFAGVSKGAAEVQKFLDEESVNRVILLSDGKANVGPQSPSELERLGASLVKEGISVSTLGLGLGYNEDLMSRLASAGSGNHAFVERADDLVAVFQKEFSDLMSVVASEFDIHTEIAEGIRPVRVLNTKADISGQDIRIPLAQLYARQQRYFVVEVEVEPGKDGNSRPLAKVTTKYQNMITGTKDTLSHALEVRFSEKQDVVAEQRDHETYAFCAIQLANDNNVRATALRDAGKIAEAEELLMLNCSTLKGVKDSYGSKLPGWVNQELERNANLNRLQSTKLQDPAQWSSSRKKMRYEQNNNASQQVLRISDDSKSAKKK